MIAIKNNKHKRKKIQHTHTQNKAKEATQSNQLDQQENRNIPSV